MKFLVPEAFLEFCGNMMLENKTLRNQNQAHNVASSTKIEDDRLQQKRDHVRLQDTYTCQYVASAAHDRSSTPQAPRTNRTQPLLGNHDRAWKGKGGVSRQNVSENLGASEVEDSSWRRRNLPIVDVSLTLRKWNVSFSGDRGQSIEVFLDKIEACRGSTSL